VSDAGADRAMDVGKGGVDDPDTHEGAECRAPAPRPGFLRTRKGQAALRRPLLDFNN
jgi:hypothetical protein